MIIDSHCHLHDEKFLTDLDNVLLSAKESNITHFIDIGCDLETTQKACDLANKYSQIYFSAGFHPHEAKFLNTNSLEKLELLAKNKKCLAIGECGLDYYYNHSNQDEQKHAFIEQLKLAHKLNLPTIIHLRDAYEDCINILQTYRQNKQKIVIHCFSGTLEQAKFFASLGIYISLSGIITFKNPQELLQVAKEIALDKLIIETDAPYLSPHPFRGKRNEPSFITHTLDKIISVRSEYQEVITSQIYKNTLDLFGLVI